MAKKTFKVNLSVSGAVDTITCDGYDLKSGALVFFNEEATSATRPRVKSKRTVQAYGPSAWASLTEEGESNNETIPVETLNEVYDVLAKAMRFLTPFANVNRGLLHDDVQADARALKIKLSDVSKKVAAFCDDEDEEDDDDD